MTTLDAARFMAPCRLFILYVAELVMMTTTEKMMIRKALLAPESFVLRMVYSDRSGSRTQRVVSPIRILDGKAMLALCLCREDCRRFELERCTSVELIDANEVLMPVELKVLERSMPN